MVNGLLSVPATGWGWSSTSTVTVVGMTWHGGEFSLDCVLTINYATPPCIVCACACVPVGAWFHQGFNFRPSDFALPLSPGRSTVASQVRGHFPSYIAAAWLTASSSIQHPLCWPRAQMQSQLTDVSKAFTESVGTAVSLSQACMSDIASLRSQVEALTQQQVTE